MKNFLKRLEKIEGVLNVKDDEIKLSIIIKRPSVPESEKDCLSCQRQRKDGGDRGLGLKMIILDCVGCIEDCQFVQEKCQKTP